MTNPQRRAALSRVREPHPAETAAAVAGADAPPAGPAPAAPPAPAAAREGTTQLNVRVRVSLKERAERGTLALGVREGRRVTLAQVVEAALDSYLAQNDL